MLPQNTKDRETKNYKEEEKKENEKLVYLLNYTCAFIRFALRMNILLY